MPCMCGDTECPCGIAQGKRRRKAYVLETPFDVTCNRLRAIIAELEADPIQQILTPEEKNELSGVVNITEVRITAWRHADGTYLNSGDSKQLIDEVIHLRDELRLMRQFLGAETRAELARQMRERASFANTTAGLKRLLETWADVIVGAPGVGGLAANRADLEWEKAISEASK